MRLPVSRCFRSIEDVRRLEFTLAHWLSGEEQHCCERALTRAFSRRRRRYTFSYDMDVKLDRATWGNVGGNVWKRDLDGIEWYENMAADIWPNEHTFVGRGKCGHGCERLTLAATA